MKGWMQKSLLGRICSQKRTEDRSPREPQQLREVREGGRRDETEKGEPSEKLEANQKQQALKLSNDRKEVKG